MGEWLNSFFAWLVGSFNGIVTGVSEGAVGFFVWATDALSGLVPLAQAAGQALTPLVLIALPGVMMYGAIRLVSRGTGKFLGATDAALTVLLFAVVIGFVFGGMFASAWNDGATHLSAVATILTVTAIGLFLGGRSTLGSLVSLYMTAAMLLVANISAVYLVLA